ncbi:MAG TPA: HIT domain-containing protein [Candidatus Margulisiibacteriota bacterium]|nr:HIT domain-containing protein [Candidatus Margulisiibacteriota bacterium]
MNSLWAPWRINYIRLEKKKKRGCIFCKTLKNGKDSYLVFKTKYSFALLNIFPYNNGHLMVSPVRHVRDISLLSEAEALDLLRTLNKTRMLLKKSLRPDGFNIGINLGESAGAGITGHMHIHIVPRWKGDTNFMPVIYKTKVVSESLRQLHKRLKICLRKNN